jgi:hypothetical protein
VAQDEALSMAGRSAPTGRLPEPEQQSEHRAGPPLDVNALRHPAEYSRLVLAAATAVVAPGVMVMFIVIVLATGPLELLGLAALLLAVAVATLWLFLVTGRAHLLGNSLLVSHESLPELQGVVDTVRDHVGYSRRVDVYVSEAAEKPVMLATFMGTRILILKSTTVSDLQTEANLPQLKFLLGSEFGALKARHQQFILLSVLLEFETKLKILNIFLAPYFRATVYTGDQIGAACCGSLPAAVAMLNRLMVGKELGSSVLSEGVVNQAAVVRKRWLPRLEQMNSTTPHLTNRYLNLMAFMAANFPEETKAYLDSLDEPARGRLTAFNESSTHRTGYKTSVAALTAVAALITALVLVLTGLGMAQWRSEILAAIEPAPSSSPSPEPEPGPTFPVPEPSPTFPVPEASPTTSNRLPLYLLLTAIPDEVEPCRQVIVEAAFGQGAVLEVECSPVNFDSLTYVEYESVAELEASYASIVPASLPGADCSAVPSSLVYDISTSNGVRALSCYENQNGAIVFVWTSTIRSALGDSHLLGICTSNSRAYERMYEEWEILVTRAS